MIKSHYRVLAIPSHFLSDSSNFISSIPFSFMVHKKFRLSILKAKRHLKESFWLIGFNLREKYRPYIFRFPFPRGECKKEYFADLSCALHAQSHPLTYTRHDCNYASVCVQIKRKKEKREIKKISLSLPKIGCHWMQRKTLPFRRRRFAGNAFGNWFERQEAPRRFQDQGL